MNVTFENFYKNSTIFITGASGYLGKVLVEKLLRSCDGVQKIYILLRGKRGIDCQERFSKFLEHQIFDRIRKENPGILKKLKLISGDVKDPNLNLSKKDMEIIINDVNIVFHAAASVRFNEPLENAINLNSFGTFRVMELCTKIKNLKSVVYVSTAYTNPYLKTVEEKVYGDSIYITEDDSVLKQTVIEEAKQLRKLYPNNYTLSKALAERVASNYHKRLPVCIVRPSIISVSLQEPYEGWVDGITSHTTILMGIGLGIAGSAHCNGVKLIDLIPVDIVSNTLILACWESSLRKSQNIKVYNCTSGQINPINVKTYIEIVLKYFRKYPLRSIVMYPALRPQKNYFFHKIYEMFLHYLPAFILDLILRSQGKKPIMLKNLKLYTAVIDIIKFCLLEDWIFKNDNYKELIETARKMNDNKFNCDFSLANWDDYMKITVLGFRKFTMKEDIKNLEEARKNLRRLYWINCSFKILSVVVATYLVRKLLVVTTRNLPKKLFK